MVVDDTNNATWQTCPSGGGSGDITDVGDCNGPVCFMDGTNDGASLVYEGATVNGNETRLSFTGDPPADNVVTIPNETGTICTTSTVCTGYGGATLAGDVDGTYSSNDLDEAAVESELEGVLDLDQLQGQIADAQIAAGAVDGGNAGEIADASVTADDLGADSVSASELNVAGVEAELEAVLDLNELQGQIADAQIADSAVDGGTGGEIADASVTAADLAADSVAASELDASAVESELEAVLDFYATVADEGSGLTPRATINFTGAGVSCADNSGSSRTDCTINAASIPGDITLSDASPSITLDDTTGGDEDWVVSVDADNFTIANTADTSALFRIQDSAATLLSVSGLGLVTTGGDLHVGSGPSAQITTSGALTLTGTAPQIYLDDSNSDSWLMLSDANNLVLKNNTISGTGDVIVRDQGGTDRVLIDSATGDTTFKGAPSVENSAPIVKLVDSTGGHDDWWFEVQGDNLTLHDVDSSAGVFNIQNGSGADVFSVSLTGSVEIAAGIPKITFTDTGADDWKVEGDGNNLTIQQVTASSTGDVLIKNQAGTTLFTFADTGDATVSGDILVSGGAAVLVDGAPAIGLLDNTSNEADYTLTANTDALTISSDEATIVALSGTAPKLRLTDTTGGDGDWDATVDADDLLLTSGGATFTFTPAGDFGASNQISAIGNIFSFGDIVAVDDLAATDDVSGATGTFGGLTVGSNALVRTLTYEASTSGTVTNSVLGTVSIPSGTVGHVYAKAMVRCTANCGAIGTGGGGFRTSQIAVTNVGGTLSAVYAASAVIAGGENVDGTVDFAVSANNTTDTVDLLGSASDSDIGLDWFVVVEFQPGT